VLLLLSFVVPLTFEFPLTKKKKLYKKTKNKTKQYTSLKIIAHENITLYLAKQEKGKITLCMSRKQNKARKNTKHI
jgi:hypothetical protein